MHISTITFYPLLLTTYLLVGLPSSLALASETSGPESNGFDLEVHGYGDMQFAYFDHGLNQNQEGGASQDSRVTFDLARLIFEIEGKMPSDVEFEAEIEFEHGGTGAAMELEYEEFGEYEADIESGGEVVVEQLYLKKQFFNQRISIKVGRFYVAYGLLPARHKPTDYLATIRPESETTLIPGVWDEMGFELKYTASKFSGTLQLVNGLDSTGFSSQRWIALGHQGRFEVVNATNPAVVGRLDFTPTDRFMMGTSVYFGDTVGNRPKPDMGDMSAPVLLLSSHFQLNHQWLRAQGAVLYGHLSNAEEISKSNRLLSNNLDVLRSAIADEAFGSWLEVGSNVIGHRVDPTKHQLEPFVRVEYYDTMFSTGDNTYDNPRFERTVIGGGVSHTYQQSIALKLDFSNRSFGEPDIRDEKTVRLATSFLF